MVNAGQQLELSIEKPAAGGRMIARHEGQVILVLGTIPGERVLARIDKADRQLAFASTLDVLVPSPDRRETFFDPSCGGCVYAHIAYRRQLAIKADVVQDAFIRLGRLQPPPIEVAASPERGYRMRGRLYVQDGRLGFYREGSRSVCDAEPTGLLSAAAVASAQAMADGLLRDDIAVKSVEVSENLSGDQRALHVEAAPGARVNGAALSALARSLDLRGCSARSGHGLVVALDPSVSDPLAALTSGRAARGVLRRSAESFFQANRFLLPELVTAVMDRAGSDGSVLELYAGVGLFSLSLAAAGHSDLTAVEGDRASSADLLQNAAQFPDAVRAVRGSVEEFLAGNARGRARTIIVDPPRSGISKAAMNTIAHYGARRIVYVSCDPPTMARDVRRLVDAGYGLTSLRAFDLFPNTPHVETVGVLEM